MKKRYIVSPLLILASAMAWNAVFNEPAPTASAEVIEAYISPESKDPNHPIEAFVVSLHGGETKADVLTQLPTTIYPEDKVTFVVDPALGLPSVVQIERAAPVVIKDGKKQFLKRTFATTVGELLGDVHRGPEGLDRASVGMDSTIIRDMTIVITRVIKVMRTVTLPEPFETVEKPDSSVDRGVKKTEEAGVSGVRTKVFEDTREDGEVVKTVALSNSVTTKPKSKIVSVGTRIRYGKEIRGTATWYNLCCTKVASNTFKKGTWVAITNTATGKSIEVKVDDSGGFGSQVAIDLHPDYFKQLGGTIGQGVMGSVVVKEVLTPPV